eukprot:GILI01034962.1.p1 GENE.GILI01034962.1~~GILI01034962.1.p1  ORF type:complete len:124 (+),score=8.69 GILI01034962.1:65-436(+)
MAPSSFTLYAVSFLCFAASMSLFILPHRIANHDTPSANESAIEACQKLPSVTAPTITSHAERISLSRDGGKNFLAIALAFLCWAYLRHRFDVVNVENEAIIAKNEEAKKRHKDRTAAEDESGK